MVIDTLISITSCFNNKLPWELQFLTRVTRVNLSSCYLLLHHISDYKSSLCRATSWHFVACSFFTQTHHVLKTLSGPSRKFCSYLFWVDSLRVIKQQMIRTVADVELKSVYSFLHQLVVAVWSGLLEKKKKKTWHQTNFFLTDL